MSTLELFPLDWRQLWCGANERGAVGAIFTRPEIVELILDLAGYRPESGPLADHRVLEPSCGDGAFLDAILCRLIESERIFKEKIYWDDDRLQMALCATDIAVPSIEAARRLMVERLLRFGCPSGRAQELAQGWTLHADFLLFPWKQQFDFVVGNPPYVRLEYLPKLLLREYRSRYRTTTDRADLYVAFLESGLTLLKKEGVLAFICANRFAKNHYGTSLRKLISERFHVRYYINLEHTQPFLQDVSAYPAIVVIDYQQDQPTRACSVASLAPPVLEQIRRQALSSSRQDSLLSTFSSWYPLGAPWVTTDAGEYAFLSHLKDRFPLLEDSATETHVGIGVATGADHVFILSQKNEMIEEDRQIPLLMASDIRSDQVEWSNHYLVNPYGSEDGDGSLVSLAEYPGLRAYMEIHATQLKSRYVARNFPHNWYRTIDRVWPALRQKAKLVLPDIQSGGVIGLDPGHYYPHHNVYWITSQEWPLRVLQALLRSSLVLLQIRAFSVQMRGGSLRYQAQTLRKLRLPAYRQLSWKTLDDLSAVATSKDQQAIDDVAEVAFELPKLLYKSAF